jgi:hypothetical protein
MKRRVMRRVVGILFQVRISIGIVVGVKTYGNFRPDFDTGTQVLFFRRQPV